MHKISRNPNYKPISNIQQNMCLEMCMGQLEGFFQLNSTHHMYENQPNQLESGWLVSCALHVSCLILKKKKKDSY